MAACGDVRGGRSAQGGARRPSAPGAPGARPSRRTPGPGAPGPGWPDMARALGPGGPQAQNGPDPWLNLKFTPRPTRHNRYPGPRE